MEYAMLRSINELKGYIISASDGEIGPCMDFLFDDRTWVVRYMVARVSKWLPGRKVIISPVFLDEPDWTGKRMPVYLTRKQIKESPPLDEHAPVSRQYEMSYHQTYALPLYWVGNQLWGAYPDPSGVVHPMSDNPVVMTADEPEVKEGHIRSSSEMVGYHISATDGDLGHVDDFLVDDVTWALRYLVVDTRNWLPGRKVLLPPQWLKSVQWVDRKVQVDLDATSIKNCPEYDATQPFKRSHEINLYEHYARDRDWKGH